MPGGTDGSKKDRVVLHELLETAVGDIFLRFLVSLRALVVLGKHEVKRPQLVREGFKDFYPGSDNFRSNPVGGIDAMLYDFSSAAIDDMFGFKTRGEMQVTRIEV